LQVEKENKPRYFYGYTIVFLVFLLLGTVMLTYSVFGVIFQPLVDEFHWNRTTISGAMSLNNLFFGIACIVFARLSEKYNLRVLIAVSGLLLGLGYFLMAATNSVWELYLSFGLVIGIGMSSFIDAFNILTRWFVKRRGLMTGIAFTATGLSAMVGAPLANWLIVTYGWRPALVILGICSLVIMLAIAIFIRREPRMKGQLPYGYAEPMDSVHVNIGLSMKEAWKSSQFWLMCFMYFTALFCTFVFNVHIVVHAIALGATSEGGANMLAIRGLISLVFASLLGVFGDRFGNKRMIAISFGLMAMVFLWMAAATTTWELYILSAAFGIAFAGFVTLMSPLVAEVFGIKAHSVILGATAFAGALGGAFGPLTAGYLFDVTAGYTWAFVICGVLAVGSLIMALRINSCIGPSCKGPQANDGRL
jgi:MFS family permease